MKREKVIEDFTVYKKRLWAIMECFNIDEYELAKFVGVRRLRMLISYKPTKEQLELIAQFCGVGIEFLKGKMLESYSAKEVEVLIFIERRAIKEDFRIVKKELLDFVNEKYKECSEIKTF